MLDDDDNERATDVAASGGNCPDDVKRDWYRKSLIAKIAEQSAKAAHAKALGSYRNLLKQADKAGVSTTAIVFALARRFEDPDMVLIEEREKLKMLELSGLLPGIRDKLFARFDVAEATRNEDWQMQLVSARDQGALAGRKGHGRDLMDERWHGTELGVEWMLGWSEGQRAIADEMGAVETAAPKSRGRPKLTEEERAARAAAKLAAAAEAPIRVPNGSYSEPAAPV